VGTHSYDDQTSTYKWINGLKGRAGGANVLARGVQILAHQAQDRQPVTPAFAAEVAAVSALLGKASLEAGELFKAARAAHRRDVERVENYRKSPAVETNADVTAARRDGM
jgi:hypothetical protein